ncbi:MAG TPA: hypothetical protein VG984_00420 [Candidatus Paceibacterota bacterium]|nr:hypothetical protein [Candidatus Paceibacterota bacterium]
MANPQLIAYIREHEAQFAKEQIVQSLASAGWAAGDISDAFAELERPAAPSASVPAPVQVHMPTTPAAAAPTADFMAEMEKRRQEAAAQNPYQNVSAASAPASQQFRADVSAPAEKGIIGLLIRMKIVKTAAQANVVMLALAAACIAFSAWLVWPTSKQTSAPVMEPMMTPSATVPR